MSKQTYQKTTSEVLSDFYTSLTSFDEENSMMKYDKAIILDTINAVARIESMRAHAKNKEATD